MIRKAAMAVRMAGDAPLAMALGTGMANAELDRAQQRIRELESRIDARDLSRWRENRRKLNGYSKPNQIPRWRIALGMVIGTIYGLLYIVVNGGERFG